MSRTKEEQRLASLPPGMLPKGERRKLGKEAAAKRAAAKRRKKLLNNLGVAAIGIIVIVGLVLIFGVFGGSSPTAAATPSATANAGAGDGTGADATPTPTPTAPALPADADPALKTKPTVAKPTGKLTKLVVTTLIQGTGPALKNGDSVWVNYVGVDFKTNTEFDSSWKRSAPFNFTLGGNVIDGWNKGLVGVKVGSRVQLDIPSAQAYGDSGSPAGDLRFVVDVIGIG